MSQPLPQQLVLDRTKCDEFLVKYLDVGYRTSKLFSIKDGAQIAKYSRILSGDEEDSAIDKEKMYAAIFAILEAMNKAGSFTLGDTTILQKIMEMITKEYVEKHEKEKEEKEANEPKIREL